MSYFRRSGRKNSRFSVQLADDHVEGMYAETKNVSETGMFVNTANMSMPSKVAVGDTVSLKIYSAEQFLESAAVEVVRVTEEGFGCSFV